MEEEKSINHRLPHLGPTKIWALHPSLQAPPWYLVNNNNSMVNVTRLYRSSIWLVYDGIPELSGCESFSKSISRLRALGGIKVMCPFVMDHRKINCFGTENTSKTLSGGAMERIQNMNRINTSSEDMFNWSAMPLMIVFLDLNPLLIGSLVTIYTELPRQKSTKSLCWWNGLTSSCNELKKKWC